VLWTLLGSVTLAALTAMGIAYRNFFTPAHQLRDLPPGIDETLRTRVDPALPR
jgi:hypothetical protein